MSEARNARARKAGLVSAYGPDHPAVAAADTELRIIRLTAEIARDGHMDGEAARRLAEYIVTTVDKAPPLTAEQLARLALLLHPGGGHEAA